MQTLSLDLVPLYSTENSAGTGFHFPRYHEKDIHSSNYPLPRVALENTTAATVNEIIGKGGVGWLVSDDSPPLTKPTLNTRVLQCA